MSTSSMSMPRLLRGLQNISSRKSFLGVETCCYRNDILIGRRGLHTNNDFSSLKINQNRLLDTLHESCEYGKAFPYGSHHTETGMARLSLNDADKEVRHWFTKQAESLGCKVTVDQMGNMFAIRPGKNSSKAPVMIGSHLDTQPTGGRYDGILGITAGLEILRTLQENDYQTEGPIGVVNWTNEEGARFPMTAVSSGVWSGLHPLEKVWNLQEVTASKDGRKHTMREELERIGFLGDVPASHEAQPFAAHFELHIEQGPILEDEGREIGVVVGGQAYKWFQITVKGKDSHAGTTPFNARQDAILSAARMIVESNTIAKSHAGLATTGIIEMQPGSINTMSHTVTFTLDIRHHSDSQLSSIESACHSAFNHIAHSESERGCTVSWTQLTDSPAVKFHPDCITAVEESATANLGSTATAADGGKLWKHMISGAGHDSCYTNRVCPTAMIFTPTRGGMSHTPDEYCKPEDCAMGAQVLMGAVLSFDRGRA